VASFLLGIGAAKSRTLFDAGTYTEKRPEIAVYMQDDYRVSSKLTLNLGLRWDIYKPWVEVDNKQSNFDPTTGKFVVAADGASIGGVDVGRYLQTYSKADVGPRLGAAYDLGGDGKTIVRFEHRDLERMGEGTVELFESMDGGWGMLLSLFKAEAERG